MLDTRTCGLNPSGVLLLIVYAIFALGMSGTALAFQPPYLDEMPTPERVYAEIKGKDELDTAARLAGTFDSLKTMIQRMAGDRFFRNQLTPDEVRFAALYAQSVGKIISTIPNRFDPGETRRLGMQSPRAKWFASYSRYSFDEESTLSQFFSHAWRRNYHVTNLRQELGMFMYRLNQKQLYPAHLVDLIAAAAKSMAAYIGIPIAAMLFALLSLPFVLIVFWLAREMRRFGLDPSDPFKLRSGWTTYTLYTTTGTVLEPTKSHEVRTHVSGGNSYVSGGHVYSQPVRTTTTTVVHDQFFIRDAESGHERPIQLQNVNLAVREGHEMSVAWGIRNGKKFGHYFLFHNHSTQNSHYIDSVIKAMLKPYSWPVLLLVLATFFVCWDLNMEAGAIALSELVVFVLFFVIRSIGTHIRARRLKRQIAARLLPALKQRVEQRIVTDSGAAITPA